jgi:hypothetical protein
MPLVRRGGCLFFIRSYRLNGRVTSRYLGSGTAATDAARAHAEARTRDEARRRERAEELARWVEFDAAFASFCRLNRAHARAAMYAAGYYLHRRQWRRRGKPMGTPAKLTPADVPETIRVRVGEFLRQNGDRQVSADDCVRFFDSIREGLTPAAYQWVIKRLVAATGRFDVLIPTDPRARAQQALVRWLTERWGHPGPRQTVNPADRELLRRYLDVLRDDVAGDDAPPLERMLSDQVVLGWVEVNGLTARTVEPESSWDHETVTHFDKRRDRATRRFHESVKLLHTIRTQAAPALQVNVSTAVAVASPAAPEPAPPLM